jgi:hypothetical protein
LAYDQRLRLFPDKSKVRIQGWKGPQTPHSSSINMGEAYVKIRNKKLKNREEKKKELEENQLKTRVIIA